MGSRGLGQDACVANECAKARRRFTYRSTCRWIWLGYGFGMRSRLIISEPEIANIRTSG
jgi:hypothetical protein